MNMKYSVILPCYNEAHNMVLTLAALTGAIGDRQDVEVIVVDNGSSDKSVVLANEFNVSVAICNRVTISRLRNVGAEHGSGKYLYFLDIDIQVPNNLFTVLDGFIEEALYDVVGYVDIAPDVAPWFARTWSLRCLARRENYGPVQWLPGRNIFVSREFFLRVGGFDERLQTGEDKDFVFRLRHAGAKVASDSRLTLFHLGYERTFQEWCRKEFWRQHSHLNFIGNQKLSLRIIRFPLLSLLHLLLAGCFLLSIFWSDLPGLLVCGLWLLPSFGQTFAFRVSRRSLGRIPQFMLLYFLRFHIAGLAIVHELYEILAKRRR